MPLARSFVSDVRTNAPAQGATIIQSFVKDPAPNNIGFYSTGGSAPLTEAMSGDFGADTATGNLLVAFSVIAWDAANLISSVSDPVNGAWTFGKEILNTTICNCDIQIWYKFNAQPLKRNAWSGTGAVSSGGVLTLGAGSGTFRLGQRIGSAHTPAANAQGGDVLPLSLLSGSQGAAGSTYQLSPGIGSTTFASEAMTSTDIVSTAFHTQTGAPDYQGCFGAEIAGTDGSSIAFASNNDAPTGAGTDTVTSGALTTANKPGLLIGCGFNGGINGVSSTPPFPVEQYYPNAGTGFTNSSPILVYNIGSAICTIEWQRFANVNGKAATYSPPAASNYASIALAVLDP